VFYGVEGTVVVEVNIVEVDLRGGGCICGGRGGGGKWEGDEIVWEMR